jgi:DNA polymerase-3 subunit gamma/tau
VSELALYRKYRSGNFAEVVGQDHVVQTLTNALSSGRLRHAYLFTGPRGVGKTSVARLLARALNCTGEPKPCNKCQNCLTAINSSLDIIEMDAASNRSIDSIRDLREKVSLAPTQGQYKVYIIDEVHMLTTEAFNALLKTLEEPPAHAVFILATTEAHKLPETIISRTQAFNFKPITTKDITTHLGKIAEAEGITVSADALDIIATSARGGFRDAISLLDQLSSAKSEPITAERVRELLGYSDNEEIFALSSALAAHDTLQALSVASRLEQSGAQATQVAMQLALQWRTILLTSAGATAAADDSVKTLASNVTTARSAEIVSTLAEISRSAWPQLAFEAALVRLTATAAPNVAHSPIPTQAATKPVQTTPPRVAQQPPVASAPAPAKVSSKSSQELGAPESALWPKVLVHIKSQNNSLAALLQMYPVDFGAEEITIKPRFNFHRDLFLKSANRLTIESAATKVYGRPVRITARTEDTAKANRPARPDQAAELVSSALEILGGEIVD